MQEYFDYLDALRDSGKTNMFGACPYLQREFEMTRKEASTVLQAWMKQFKEQTV